MFDSLETFILEQSKHQKDVKLYSQPSNLPSKQNYNQETPTFATNGLIDHLNYIFTIAVQSILSQNVFQNVLKNGLKFTLKQILSQVKIYDTLLNSLNQSIDQGRNGILGILNGVQKSIALEAKNVINEVVEDIATVFNNSLILYIYTSEIVVEFTEKIIAIMKLQQYTSSKLYRRLYQLQLAKNKAIAIIKFT